MSDNAKVSNAGNVNKGIGSNASKVNSSNTSKGNAKSNVTENAKNIMNSDKMPMIIIIAVTILLFIFVILYITFAMKSGNLKGKVLLEAPVRVDRSDSPIQIESANIPRAQVGREYTYAFWMYLDSLTTETNSANTPPTPYHRVVMYRGNVGSAASANPLVLLDGLSNKLHIIIKTTSSSIESTTVNNDLDEIIRKNYFLSNMTIDSSGVNKHLVCTIDYVPLQRWINVGFVIDNKIITVYLDGEIYSVKSTDEFKSYRKPYVNRLGKTIEYNLVIDKSEGDVFVGKTTVGAKRVFNGWMGKMEFFNYALTMEQMKKVYQTGPMPRGILAMLGLGQYGFRAPVYKLNQSVQ